MKRITLALLTLVISLSMTACFGNNSGPLKEMDNKHAKVVKKDLEVFESGDISIITERVFGEPADGSDTSDGIIADLFANADVQITAADDTSVTYTIVSPDISDFFTACAEELDSITTSEELGQAILAYAETAPQKEYTVSIEYTISDEGIDMAYDTPEFINAMTGGLVDAYADLYDQYLEEMG